MDGDLTFFVIRIDPLWEQQVDVSMLILDGLIKSLKAVELVKAVSCIIHFNTECFDLMNEGLFDPWSAFDLVPEDVLKEIDDEADYPSR